MCRKSTNPNEVRATQSAHGPRLTEPRPQISPATSSEQAARAWIRDSVWIGGAYLSSSPESLRTTSFNQYADLITRKESEGGSFARENQAYAKHFKQGHLASFFLVNIRWDMGNRRGWGSERKGREDNES